jgi:hypothetical protein
MSKGNRMFSESVNGHFGQNGENNNNEKKS